MISSHGIPTIAILCIFIGPIQQVRHLGRERKQTKKAAKNDIERRACSQKIDIPHKFFYGLFSLTQSFLLSFSWSSDNITASNKKSTCKKEPISVSEIAISYLNKNIIIPQLCQCGLFVQTCVPENSLVSLKMWFSAYFDITNVLKQPYMQKSFFQWTWTKTQTQKKWTPDL